MQRIVILAALASLTAAAPLAAQGRRGDGIPPGQRPPAGLCRVWIDGVPPGRQPRATNCAVAQASVPRNGRVIWGDRTRDWRTLNGDVVPADRSCRRQVVNGVVRVACANSRVNKKHSSYVRRRDEAYRDRYRKPEDRDREDRDRFERR